MFVVAATAAAGCHQCPLLAGERGAAETWLARGENRDQFSFTLTLSLSLSCLTVSPADDVVVVAASLLHR